MNLSFSHFFYFHCNCFYLHHSIDIPLAIIINDLLILNAVNTAVILPHFTLHLTSESISLNVIKLDFFL